MLRGVTGQHVALNGLEMEMSPLGMGSTTTVLAEALRTLKLASVLRTQ